MAPRPNRPHRQSRTGNQSIWIFGRHAVLAALANPDRRIERLFATKEMADNHAAESCTTVRRTVAPMLSKASRASATLRLLVCHGHALRLLPLHLASANEYLIE